jgi:hypothetical protein
MLRYFTAIVVLNPEIIDDLEQKSEAKKREINAVIDFPHAILHRTVNTENVKRLDDEIDNDDEKGIDKKFSIHIYRCICAAYWAISLKLLNQNASVFLVKIEMKQVDTEFFQKK